MGLLVSQNMEPSDRHTHLRGKVALVTGGNTGIGYPTVEQLALHGASVDMAARSESKATKAIEDLYRDHPHLEKGCIIWLPLDLSDLNSVVKAAETVRKAENKLDILVNNAGMAASSFEITEAGFDLTMAVCHVGHFVLTDGVLQHLKAAASQKDADVRVVTLSSGANSVFVPSTFDFNFGSPSGLANPCSSNSDSYGTWRASMRRYGVAKLANILFATEFQRRCDAETFPIISTSIHQGGVSTEGAMGTFPGFLQPIMRRIFVSPLKGATTGLFAATAGDVRREDEKWKGKYHVPYGKLGTPHSAANDPKMAMDLWETTRKAVEKYVPQTGAA